MLSTIWCLSRQAKNASRACQQWARRSRFGASKAPSGEGVGGGGEVCGGVVKRPILGGERGWCDGAAGGGLLVGTVGGIVVKGMEEIDLAGSSVGKVFG